MNQSKPDLDFVVCQYCSGHCNSSRLPTPLRKTIAMPPPLLRPFPVPSLSIGTDIAHIPRIARLVASQRTLPRFLRKLFTSREERAFHLRFRGRDDLPPHLDADDARLLYGLPPSGSAP